MKFIDLETQYNLLKDEIDQNINRVLNHGQYIMGPEISQLENNLSEFANDAFSIIDKVALCAGSVVLGYGLLLLYPSSEHVNTIPSVPDV